MENPPLDYLCNLSLRLYNSVPGKLNKGATTRKYRVVQKEDIREVTTGVH